MFLTWEISNVQFQMMIILQQPECYFQFQRYGQSLRSFCVIFFFFASIFVLSESQPYVEELLSSESLVLLFGQLYKFHRVFLLRLKILNR